MKRLLIIFFMTIVALIANAKAPQIYVEQFFDGRYNKEKSVRTSVSKENGRYYRVLHVANNQAIVEEIYKTLSKDAETATKFFEQTGEGGKSTVVQFINNDETIHIGFQQDPSGTSASLFINGSEKAFK
ncbi:MAG: hypothetical protein K2J63_02305 [Muribaculaceae bacterium]|nr:hypothetical protein [Muribaculaceae bacterium]